MEKMEEESKNEPSKKMFQRLGTISENDENPFDRPSVESQEAEMRSSKNFTMVQSIRGSAVNMR